MKMNWYRRACCPICRWKNMSYPMIQIHLPANNWMTYQGNKFYFSRSWLCWGIPPNCTSTKHQSSWNVFRYKPWSFGGSTNTDAVRVNSSSTWVCSCGCSCHQNTSKPPKQYQCCCQSLRSRWKRSLYNSTLFWLKIYPLPSHICPILWWHIS